jgi:hypothetical protein
MSTAVDTALRGELAPSHMCNGDDFFLLASSLKDITYISYKPSFDNMDAEQFDRLMEELKALRMEIERFNDRFELVSSKVQERPKGWINEVDMSRPATRS